MATRRSAYSRQRNSKASAPSKRRSTPSFLDCARMRWCSWYKRSKEKTSMLCLRADSNFPTQILDYCFNLFRDYYIALRKDYVYHFITKYRPLYSPQERDPQDLSYNWQFP